ncbi:alpha/beta fold hydrolase [Roseovarius sp. 2305UL8-3]|uniref:alpha/beta fold hydrolase n=1 Tax=Roseovarius conchicola TaxID=3121636 RepID=UPI00352954A9
MDRTFIHEGRSVRWGKIGEGPPLVLIHGTPFSSQVWRRIAPLLARQWTVYYFDLLGYGASEKGGDVSLGVQNGLLAALLGYWKLERPEVLCHDFGGATALRAYYLDGLRYQRLVIIDAVALAPWGSPFVAHVRHHQSVFTGLPAYAHDALLAAYLKGAAYGDLSAAALDAYMGPWQGEEGQAAFYAQIAQMDQRFTDEVEPFYGALDCPVTVLWGEEDAWIPIEKGEDLARKLSDRPLIRVPGAGHLMQDDAPEAIIAAMLGGG